MCRLAANGIFPITMYEDLFENEEDYHEVVKRLEWIENKYSSCRKPGWIGLASVFREHLVTYSLSLIMVASSAILFLADPNHYLSAINHFAFSKNVFETHEYYRAVTAFFLHINPFHLLVNLISLGILGGMLERYIGKVKYFNIIVVSTLCGWIASETFSQHDL